MVSEEPPCVTMLSPRLQGASDSTIMDLMSLYVTPCSALLFFARGQYKDFRKLALIADRSSLKKFQKYVFVL
jgi:hypothetical protein